MSGAAHPRMTGAQWEEAYRMTSKRYKDLRLWLTIGRLPRRVRKDPRRASYRDQALALVGAADSETLALFTHNEGARAAMQQARKIKELTGSKTAAL